MYCLFICMHVVCSSHFIKDILCHIKSGDLFMSCIFVSCTFVFRVLECQMQNQLIWDLYKFLFVYLYIEIKIFLRYLCTFVFVPIILSSKLFTRTSMCSMCLRVTFILYKSLKFKFLYKIKIMIKNYMKVLLLQI